ncbi:CTD phosphatase Fcp1 [Dimargaris cristalligena]|nr:CTD phosphatase Fcp1 [Dimargaris cristalligena]
METLRDVSIPEHHLPATVVALKIAEPSKGAEPPQISKGGPLCIYEYQVFEPPTDDESDDEDGEKLVFTTSSALESSKKLSTKLPPIWKKRRDILRSPIEGTLHAVRVQVGHKLTGKNEAVVTVTEPCSHAVQYFGQCAICGKDLAFADAPGTLDTSRATIRMAHDMTGLTVSRDEAQRLEQETAERLLEGRKLSLIVDLDQTIIHANATRDPMDAWLAECSPELRADVGCFQLPESPLLYYIKLRPGLRDFLTRVSALYELHIYTMGTRAYAEKVAELIDPDHQIFKERILSRDESGSVTHKNIQRLFPCDSSMVVAIDDRADVWQNSPHLIKVKPYSFFTGIGDINSGFLPKQNLPTTEVTPTPPPPPPPKVLAPVPADVSEKPSEPVNTVPTDDSTPLPPKEEALSEPAENETTTPTATPPPTVVAEPDDNSAAAPDTAIASEPTPVQLVTAQSTPPIAPSVVFKHPFEDHDRELDRIYRLLSQAHAMFYNRVDDQQQGAGGKKPDVAEFLSSLKRRVLRDVHIVFSSVIRLDVDPRRSDIWQWARSFGARCSESLPRSGTSNAPRVTHLVAGKPDTAKVKEARRLGGVEIVKFEWLIDSLHSWKRLDEAPYRWPTSTGRDPSRTSPRADGATSMPPPPNPETTSPVSKSPHPIQPSPSSAQPVADTPCKSDRDGDGAATEIPPDNVLNSAETWSTQSDRDDTSYDSDAPSNNSDDDLLDADLSEEPQINEVEMEAKLAYVDWDEADADLKEFMGTDTDDLDDDEDDDDDDDASVASEKKRRPHRADDSMDEEDDFDEDASASDSVTSSPNSLVSRKRTTSSLSDQSDLSGTSDNENDPALRIPGTTAFPTSPKTGRSLLVNKHKKKRRLLTHQVPTSSQSPLRHELGHPVSVNGGKPPRNTNESSDSSSGSGSSSDSGSSSGSGSGSGSSDSSDSSNDSMDEEGSASEYATDSIVLRENDEGSANDSDFDDLLRDMEEELENDDNDDNEPSP